MTDPSDIPMERRKSLHDLPNVIATGIGPKLVDGERTGELSLIVFVETKEDVEQLHESELVPDEIQGVPTDIQQSSEFTPDADVERPSSGSSARNERTRPFIGGVSVGHPEVNAGSSSGVFLDGDGDEVLLTNRHIAAEDGLDSVGDDFLQPGALHGGDPNNEDDIIGEVKSLGPWGEEEINETDSAVVELTETSIGGYLGHPTPSEAIEPDFGMRVIHPSRSIGLTSGPLIAVDVEATVNHGWALLEYEGLVSYEPVSAGGSSGALNLHYNPDTGEFHPIGLHFASSSTRSLMVPWETVEEHHGELEPVESTETADLSEFDSHFELTLLTNRVDSDGVLEVLVANIGDNGSDTITLSDENGYITEEQLTLGSGAHEIIEFEMANGEEGSRRFTVESSDAYETSNIEDSARFEEDGESQFRPGRSWVTRSDLPAATAGGALEITAGNQLPGTAGEHSYSRVAGQSAPATAGGPLPATASGPLPATAGTPRDETQPERLPGQYALTMFLDGERLIVRDTESVSWSRERSAVNSMVVTVPYADEEFAEWRFAETIFTYDERTQFSGQLREVDPDPSSGLTTLTIYGPGYSLKAGDLTVSYRSIRYSDAIAHFWGEYTDFVVSVTERQGSDSPYIDRQEFSGTPLEILNEMHERAGYDWYIDPQRPERAHSFPQSRAIRELDIQPIGSGYNPSWDTTDYYNSVVVYGSSGSSGVAFENGEIDEKGEVGPYPEYDPDLESDEDCRNRAETLLEEFLRNDEQSGSIEMVPRSVNPGTAMVIDEWDDDRRVGPYSLFFDGDSSATISGERVMRRLYSGTLTMWVKGPFDDPAHNPHLFSGSFGTESGTFRITDSLNLTFRIGGSNGVVSVDTFPDTIVPTDEWIFAHYDWQYDRSEDRTTVRAGRNGEIISEGGFSGRFAPPTGGLNLARYRNDYYEGHIDDVRLFNTRQSEDRYQQLSERRGIPATDLISRWPFNEGSAATGNGITRDIIRAEHAVLNGAEFTGNPLPVENVEFGESSGEYSMSVDLAKSESWYDTMIDNTRNIRSISKR